MADVRIRFQGESRQAQGEVSRLRNEVQQLRQQLGQSQTASRGAAEAVDKFGDESRQAATSVDALGDQSQQSARQVVGLGNATRRADTDTVTLTRTIGGASQGVGGLTRSLGGLSTVFAGLGIAGAGAAVLGFGVSAARAQIQVEGATNSFSALGLGAEGAARRVDELIELSRNPGISFPQAINAAVRLETVGISGERANRVITEFGNSLALVGSTDLSGILLGLTQIVSAGKVTTEEIRQITERSGLAAQAIREEFGSLIGDDIQKQLESAGQSVQDFVDRLVNRLSTQGRAAVDSTQNSIQNLQNSFFLLSAEIGSNFTPALGAAARGISGFLDGITDAIQGSKEFSEVLAEINAELSRASGRQELQDAIKGGSEAIEAFIRQAEAAIRNNSVFFGGREDAILTGQINQARAALEEYNGIAEQNIETEAELRAELERQNQALSDVQQRQTERNNLIAEQGRSAERASRIFLEERVKEEDAINASIDELEDKLSAYEAVGMGAEAATDTATEGLNETAEAAKDAEEAVKGLSDVLATLQQNIAENQGLLIALADTQVNDFYRVASGEIENFQGNLEAVIPSVVDTEANLGALEIAIEANNSVMQTAIKTGSDLDVVLTQLSEGLTSIAADQAIATAEFNLVNPAVSQAARSLRDYNDVLLEAGVNYRDIDDISQDLTNAVRGNADAFDDLSRSAEAAEIDISGALDSLDSEVIAVATEVDVLGEAFQNLGDHSGQVLDQLIGEFSQLDGVVGDLGTKIGQFDIAGLASGNPNAIATLPFQLYNAFTFDQRQAEARLPELDRANRSAFERGEFGIPTDLLAFGRGQVGRATAATDDPQLQSLLQGLDPVIGQTSLDAVATIPDRIIETIQGYTDQILTGLTEELSQATFNLDFARQSGGDVQGALQDVITANTNLYQTQIDSYNLQRQATGRAVGNVDELNRILNALNNQTRQELSGVRDSYSIGGSSVRVSRPEDRAITAQINTYFDDPDFRSADQVEAAEQAITEEQARAIGNALDRSRFSLDEGVNAFQNAAQIGVVTIEQINELWTTHVEPNLTAYYDAAQAHADTIEDPEQRQLFIDQNHLQSPEAFAQSLETQYLAPVIDAQRADDIADALTQAKFNLDEGTNAFRNAAQIGTVTVEQIQGLWDTHVAPNIDDYFSAAQNHANTIDDPDDRSLFIQQNHLQSPDAFRQHLMTTFLNPIVDAQKADDIADSVAQAKFNLDSGTDAFQNAAQIGTVTVEQIQGLWTQHVEPNINEYYQAALKQADTIADPDDRSLFIQQNHLQSPEAFKQFLINTFLNPVIDAQTADNIGDAVTKAKFDLDQGTMAFQNAAIIGTVTVERINELWAQHVEPNIDTYYQAALAQANTIDDPDDRSLFIQQHHLQSPDAFKMYLIDTFLNPVIDGQKADNIGDAVSRSKFNLDQGTMAFQNATSIPGLTTERINELWAEHVEPNINVYFNAALEEANAIDDPDDRDLFIRENHLQSPEAFKDFLITTILNPVIDTQKATAIGNAVATAKFNLDQGTNAFRNAAVIGTVTVEQINGLWTEHVEPNIDTYYQAALDHADTIQDPVQRDLFIQQHHLQSPEAFASYLETTYLNPVIDSQKADDIGDGVAASTFTFNQGVMAFQNAAGLPGLTRETLQGLWDTHIAPNLDGYYANLTAQADAIVDPDDRDLFIRENRLQSPGAFEQFLYDRFVSPVVETITNRETQTARSAGRTATGRARFNLGDATSESNFEDLRGVLISNINAFYDAEEQRIRDLGGTVDEVNAAVAANDQSRREEIRSATNLTNQFAQDRLRAEERVQDDIQDLRDDAVENEADRQQDLIDLEQETQDRITDIHRKANQSREDIQREFERDFADTFRESQEAIAQLLADEGISGEDAQQFLAGFEGEARSQLSASGLERLRDIQSQRLDTDIDVRRERDRDIEDVGIREGRQLEDVDRQHQEALIGINARAIEATETLNSNIATLVTELGNLNASETEVASIADAAEAQTIAAEKTDTAAEKMDTAATKQGEVADSLIDSDIPGAIDLVRESAQASLGISTAINSLPGLLEDSFAKIFDDLQETIVNILQIEQGIRQGGAQFILDTLIEAEGEVSGLLGTVSGLALRNLGIDPEQFNPEVANQAIAETLAESTMAAAGRVQDVNVVNPDDIYNPERIAALTAEGFNNREIGMFLRDAVMPITQAIPDIVTPMVIEPIVQDAVVPQLVDSVSISANSVSVSGTIDASGLNLEGNINIENNVNAELRLDDGTLAPIENRLVQRIDQGASPIKG